MKIIIILMIMFGGSSLAQNDTNDTSESGSDSNNEQKKRPSWSQGLPERQTAPTATSLLTKPKADIDVEPDLQAIRPELETPQVDLGFKPKPASEFTVEPVSLTLSREELRETYYENDEQENEVEVVDEALLAQYKWQVLEVSAVELPENYNPDGFLNLNIHINPKGEVINVLSADDDISSSALRVIKRSIKKWRFEPPADLGISSNMSKVFEIDIQAE